MMTTTMRVDLLGGVAVSGADSAHVRGPSRAVLLLAYLAAHPESPQPRAHLAGLLWPDSTDGQARTNLRRELHHLRTMLRDNPCLQASAGSLCWQHRPDCLVDVHEFLTASRRAVAALAADEPTEVGEHSAVALALYKGPFLPGSYDEWVLTVREDLRRTCLDLCDRVAAYWLARDQALAGVPFARRRVLLEPLEESGHRLLMRAQRRAGDGAGAVRTYHQCASLLVRELGVGPSPETRAELDAATRARADDGTAGGTGGAAGTTSGTGATDPVSIPLSPALTGRGPEHARLMSAWRGARDRGALVVVSGEAGVGKTRLVAELAHEVQRQDALVATTRCFAATGTVPLAPVADWLRHPQLRAATRRLEPVWQAEVDRLVPEHDGTTDPRAGARAKVDAWQRVRFFEGLARAFLAVDRPLLLTLDDLQWCDKATMSWLCFLMSCTGSAPILVVATAREEELEGSDLARTLDTMRGARQAEVVRLDTLSSRDAGRLAAEVLGHTVSPVELDLLTSATGGNPFFLLEALRETASSPGTLRPDDLHGVLANRLAQLPDPARDLVALASAVGRDFTFDLLIEASALDAGAVVRAVDDLWRRRILEEHGHGYDFTHDLLREAAYGMISPPRRWLLHRRLAQALEVLHADHLDSVAAQLAHQHDRSGHPDRALPHYESAARRATAVFAHAESVRLWQRCLALLGDLPASTERDGRELRVLQELLPPTNAWLGYASGTLEEYERRTSALGARLGLADVRCTAAIALFATTFVQGHTAEAHEWGRQALTLSEEHPELAAQAHMAFAGSGLGLGLLPLADQHFRLACDLAHGTDSLPIGTRTEVHTQSWWAHARWLLGDERGAADASARAVEQARIIEHPYSLTVALAYAAVTGQLLGDLRRLPDVLAELTDVCERYGFAYYREWATVLTGWMEGGPAGLRRARSGIRSLEQEGSLARMPYWLSLVADLHRRGSDTSAAAATLDAAASLATEHDDRWWLPEVLRARAELDPTARAVRRLEQAAALARSQGNVALLDRCRADLATRTGA